MKCTKICWHLPVISLPLLSVFHQNSLLRSNSSCSKHIFVALSTIKQNHDEYVKQNRIPFKLQVGIYISMKVKVLYGHSQIN